MKFGDALIKYMNSLGIVTIVGIIWWAADMNAKFNTATAQVAQNTVEIKELRLRNDKTEKEILAALAKLQVDIVKVQVELGYLNKRNVRD